MLSTRIRPKSETEKCPHRSSSARSLDHLFFYNDIGHFSERGIVNVFKSVCFVILVVASRTGYAGESPLRAADVLTCKELKAARLNLGKSDQYCCSSSNGTSFWVTDMVHFKPKDGYYVRVVVDARALAREMLAMSCKPKDFFDSSKKCSAGELDMKVKKTLDNMTYGDLYGKYKNAWDMLDADGVRVPLTAKFGGHHVYRFDRKNGIDTLILGPVLKRPARLQLRFTVARPTQEIAVSSTPASHRE